jgi:hypothetical protein
MVDEIRPNQAITHSKLLYDSSMYGGTRSSGGDGQTRWLREEAIWLPLEGFSPIFLMAAALDGFVEMV